MDIKKKRIKQDITALFLIAAIFLVLQLLGIGWLCPFDKIFGIPCPACGFTRAWQSVLQLNITQAFYYHPLFWLPIPLVIYYIYVQYIAKEVPRNYQRILYITVGIIVIVYILRWLGWIPFSYQLEFNQQAWLVHFLS